MMRTIAALTLALATTAVVSAENWPAWRGPGDGGVSPESNLPSTWSDTQNVAWRTRLKGLGVSTPIVWGNRIFVTSQVGNVAERGGTHPTLVTGAELQAVGEKTLGGRKQGERAKADDTVRFILTALDRTSGTPAWEHVIDAEAPLPELHEKHNLASPSPATDGERIYAWYGTGQLVAVDMNGKTVWQRNLAKEIAPVSILWGPGSSPAVYGKVLYLLSYHGQAAYLMAVDTATGKTKWKVDGTPGVTSYSTPVMVQAPSGPELIVNSSEGVAGHNPDTGARLWFYAEANSFPVPAPIPAGGLIYLNRGYRSSPYMAIRPGGRGDIAASHVVWRQPTSGPYVPSLVHYNGLLYMATDAGIVSCIDAATGQRVWQERIPGVYMGSPVAGDGKIYFADETGTTLVLEAGRTLKVLAKNKLSGRFGASPAIAGGRIFLRADDELVAIGK
ncbi:MAG: PQQ-binding-like beta-propeller repeat protein [Vicinamibacterales bacterium]|nr:PQQ-binding-like beta-propeller repeat protein [Vicinamibacterales bacterium]